MGKRFGKKTFVKEYEKHKKKLSENQENEDVGEGTENLEQTGKEKKGRRGGKDS